MLYEYFVDNLAAITAVFKLHRELIISEILKKKG